MPVALLALCVLLAATSVLAGESTATVSYVTRSMIYVDAGTDQGLEKGSAIDVRRDGESVAQLTVTGLSSRRSACAVPESHDIRVGDTAVFQGTEPPRAEAPVPVEGTPTPLHFPAAHEGPRDRIPGIWSGRVGFRFMARADAAEHGTDLVQPALDVRAGVAEFGWPEMSLEIDIRTRRTITSTANANRSIGRTRVYRAAAEWKRRDSPWSVNAGRQLVSAVASIGVIDGVTLEYRGSRWSAGALTGTQPDFATYGFATDIREHGLFVARSSAPRADHRWRLALAALGAYEGAEVRREHLAVQGRWNTRRFFATVLQDVDVNRSWRAEQESRLSLTSSFWTARFRWTRSFSLNTGFDARRSVRTEPDDITPETEFDDSYRRGYWGGVAFSPHPRARLSLDGRRSDGGSGGVANSATARARLSAPRWRGSSLATRHTVYDNRRALGLLQSVTAGFDLTSRTRLEATWGARRETATDGTSLSGESSNDATWWSMEAQAYLSRGWYLLGDVEHTAGDREDNTLFFLSAVRRFR